MNQQIPDRWVILNIKTAHRAFQVVLAGWNGSYLGSDSWRRSSPIASRIEDEEKVIATTASGTEYILHKSRRGFSGLMHDIYARMVKEAKGEAEISVEPSKEATEARDEFCIQYAPEDWEL